MSKKVPKFILALVGVYALSAWHTPVYGSALYALGVGLTVDSNTSDLVNPSTSYFNLAGTTHTSNLPASLNITINPNDGGSLLLAGATGKTWQSGGDDAQNVNLFWRVYESGTAAGSRPSFTSYNLLYQNQWNPDGNINKYWESTSAAGTVNVLAGLTGTALGTIASPKNYTLEFYGSSFMTYNGGNFTSYLNGTPAGSNYTTSFQLVPEPSSASLLTMTLVGSLALRRRRNS